MYRLLMGKDLFHEYNVRDYALTRKPCPKEMLGKACTNQAQNLIMLLLEVEPEKRASPTAALQHRWFISGTGNTSVTEDLATLFRYHEQNGVSPILLADAYEETLEFLPSIPDSSDEEAELEQE